LGIFSYNIQEVIGKKWMLVGYARTSTIEQQAGFDGQFRDLKNAGCEKVFSEQVSSVNANRPELERTIDFVREGDILVVTRLDRLARSVADLNHIVGRLHQKTVGLKILAEIYQRRCSESAASKWIIARSTDGSLPTRR
jgi:DNA invertase Pin-like site-specific DNA recombinase